MERIRYSARNRLCAEVVYRGVARVVEPYSLRYPSTGNVLLYVFELDRGGQPSHRIKALNTAAISSARITDRPFVPRYLVEL
jgi:hypothetical protein